MTNVVIVDRDGASSVKGQVVDVNDDTVVISYQERGSFEDGTKNTFIELKDVRGVTVTDAT
jgi:hypothetical protein